ncbi:MAG: NADH-quinone oxidoreductase subunit G [Phenylobacterium sp.]|uniref:NADH-quinone oxidoreductase subunit NuoG n=1 Tax=Phenylobacterium sp. TaxID=1871053 RepID=UPI0025EC509D|nr:NADH-quinone oxidoreductase subunit NuoG [Phenylobacterium sp.]MCA3724179.1 NADH-quinone oxidoreductase subunit G [Phenylobacterium sp.]MCA3727883.1 NADH-quinone oxidoreductase subunit G [Phenylobacterium sp.]MCA3757082.1 NADH-quinone oxidoreductase subunit G [Phenylobacterium sp.]MCA6240405.1 NADH-quinone oxidoreductase subunit G [Phenylobacterium sp.]MCA6259819.1 NADH-quinone oxidoreductase subunit G [Phenylobacterium sp.]
MPKAKVNGVEVEFEPGMTVLQVAELAGEEIPRFCYHERLSIAGNCRMCLVEVKPGPPKPQASCALPAADNQEIFTNTPMVKKAREGVMEFLLINHPLDCPICDQGGECDLQDQAMGYGRDDSRFALNKRAVEEKAMGPLINTVMTRCIQCTRCVRFITEVAGVPEIGLISRGEDVEITTYLGSAVTSELSGNVIDLCPVGALTSKPYAFNARPWELKKTETVDVMDAMGAAIRVDSRGPAVLRVLPRINDEINEEWISDKTRFAVDGLSRQRLDTPYIRENGRLRPASWKEALDLAASRLSAAAPARIGAIAGDLQDAESLKATLDLFRALGSANTDCRQDGMALGTGPRESWLFNATIAGLEEADAILLVGTNPRFEAPVLNARLRRRWLAGALEVGLIGEAADLTYDFDHLGETASALTALAKSRSGFAKVLKSAKAPALIIGAGALSGQQGAAVAHAAAQVAKAFGMSWNVLHTAASRVGGLDMGFIPGEGGLDARTMTAKGALDVLFLLGADEIDLSASDAFRIYLGSHGDAGAHAADLILPGAAYTEKDGLYVNLEGRVQMGQRAVFPKGEAREDWTILRALSERLGKTLPYDSLDQLRARLFADHPTFGQIDWAPKGQADLSAIGAAGEVGDAPLASAVKAFHLTNPVARASVTMAECAALAAGPAKMAAE